MPLHFCKRSALLFANQKKSEEDSGFYEKRQKAKIPFSVGFAASPVGKQHAWTAVRSATKSIWIYRSFHKNTLLLDSEGNLYMETSTDWNIISLYRRMFERLSCVWGIFCILWVEFVLCPGGYLGLCQWSVWKRGMWWCRCHGKSIFWLWERAEDLALEDSQGDIGCDVYSRVRSVSCGICAQWSGGGGRGGIFFGVVP